MVSRLKLPKGTKPFKKPAGVKGVPNAKAKAKRGRDILRGLKGKNVQELLKKADPKGYATDPLKPPTKTVKPVGGTKSKPKAVPKGTKRGPAVKGTMSTKNGYAPKGTKPKTTVIDPKGVKDPRRGPRGRPVRTSPTRPTGTRGPGTRGPIKPIPRPTNIGSGPKPKPKFPTRPSRPTRRPTRRSPLVGIRRSLRGMRGRR